MMRQAGRYLPEYQEVRAKADFLTICRTPELAAEVTLQPVHRLGVDGAVIFSDILLVLEAMGLPVRFEEKAGPQFDCCVRSKGDVANLQTEAVAERLRYVAEAITLCRKELAGRGVPVIGFAGAPWTLACYALEGKTTREFLVARRALYEDAALLEALMGKIAEATAAHLIAQMEAGATVLQLFESWGGSLGCEEYACYALPALQAVIARVQKARGAREVPVIVYCNGSAAHLHTLSKCGAEGISVDWRLPLDEVRRRVGPEIAIQGNLDPAALYGSPEQVVDRTQAMLGRHSGPGLIANLGHGILPDVPVENAAAFVRAVQTWQNPGA
jgi:uroporphyrinogen decarboxylase